MTSVHEPGYASEFQLPPGPWATVEEALCARFAHVAPQVWARRFARGLIRTVDDEPLARDAPFRAGLTIRYWREVEHETPIAAEETVLHADRDLVVADKPHGLAVAPTGQWVEQTLLRRLQRRLGNPALAPLHRLDRQTAGLVLLSARPESRPLYHALFRDRRIAKVYHALAPPLPAHAFPLTVTSRIVRGEPFFRMAEADGAPNSETRIDVLERGARLWRYELRPTTGRKHQLRVHLAALGAPIAGDPYYPDVRAEPDVAGHAMALLAYALEFEDPLTGARRHWRSARSLDGF